jgi:CHASE3 domain sensor protein
MDPFTLIAAATSIYSGIKSAVGAGEDALKTAERVGNLFSKVAQITQLTSAPRKKKLFQSQGEFEAEAVKLYAIKAKAQEMQLETKNLFIGTYGKAAWDNIQREVIEMRKQAAREAAAALKEQEENRKDLIMVSSIVGFMVIGIGVIGVILMVTVK